MEQEEIKTRVKANQDQNKTNNGGPVLSYISHGHIENGKHSAVTDLGIWTITMD